MGCCPKGPPKVPTMPLTANIWQNGGVTPPVGPPDVAAVACTLVPGDRVESFVLFPAMGGQLQVLEFILFPARTDVRDPNNAAASLIECPAGTARYYVCICADDVGRGFSNEYRQAACIKKGAWPAPIP